MLHCGAEARLLNIRKSLVHCLVSELKFLNRSTSIQLIMATSVQKLCWAPPPLKILTVKAKERRGTFQQLCLAETLFQCTSRVPEEPFSPIHAPLIPLKHGPMALPLHLDETHHHLESPLHRMQALSGNRIEVQHRL